MQRGRRGQRDEQLEVLLAELPDLQPRGEHDHAEHAAGDEQRRGEHAAHAGGEDARGSGETLVGGGVEHERRLAPLGGLAQQAAREEDAIRAEPRWTRHHVGQVAGAVEQQHRGLLGAQVGEYAVEDHLEQRVARGGLGERLVHLVDEVQPFGVAAQLFRGARRLEIGAAHQHRRRVAEDCAADRGRHRMRARAAGTAAHDDAALVGELEQVAVGEAGGASERPPVDAGAGARAEVLGPQLVAAPLDAQMLARDPLVRELDRALRAAPDDELIAVHRTRRARHARGIDLERPARGHRAPAVACFSLANQLSTTTRWSFIGSVEVVRAVKMRPSGATS
jgi:hypothetical protein